MFSSDYSLSSRCHLELRLNLPDSSIWTFQRHFKITTMLVLLHSTTGPIPPSCRWQKIQSFLILAFSFQLLLFITTFCWLYLRNISQIHPFLTISITVTPTSHHHFLCTAVKDNCVHSCLHSICSLHCF